MNPDIPAALARLDIVMKGWIGSRRFEPRIGHEAWICETHTEEMLRIAIVCGSIEGRSIGKGRVGFTLAGRVCSSYDAACDRRDRTDM